MVSNINYDGVNSTYLQFYHISLTNLQPKDIDNNTEEIWFKTGNNAVWLHHVLYSIRTCFLPIVFLGTVTNAFNFSILLRRDMRFLSTSVYLFALAIADMGVMYFELFRIWFEWADLVPPEIYFTSAYCKIANYMNGVTRDFSNWLIACLTLERLIMVAFPFKAKNFCKVSTARKVTVGLLTFLCVPHIHCLVFSVPINGHTGWTCWEDQSNKVGVLLSTVMDFTFGYLVILVVFVLNILLMTLLGRSKLAYLSCTGNHKRANKNRRLTRTLFAVALVFLCCETPRIIMAIIYRFLERTATRRIILNISFVLSGLNHACNFFIYVLASPRFRLLLSKTFPFRLFKIRRASCSHRHRPSQHTKSLYRGCRSNLPLRHPKERPTTLLERTPPTTRDMIAVHMDLISREVGTFDHVIIK